MSSYVDAESQEIKWKKKAILKRVTFSNKVGSFVNYEHDNQLSMLYNLLF